ncbi:efflux RND transporter permease subunit [Microbulbifer agarilyticus]|uniref:efflux RND transporter permease subunit n=1 Tax=Microbulbifer agarilyticus TaxID=260552 RepID=UPI001CD645F1|nr:efflux RND transporter permease subunit [Microbulbifer agarilyticus]MCA0899763.1 efflux RND transporter permease subunit [Microbulbifer agarilyticus]
MSLTNTALKNPAATAVAVVLAVLLGAFLASKLPVQLFPDIENPQITIQAGWRAASPKEVEAEIVEPIESVLQGVTGLEMMQVNAGRGGAWVNLEFAMGTDMDKVLIDVISRMSSLPPLPRDAEPPRVMLGGWGGNTSPLTYFFLQLLPGNPNTMQEYTGLIEDVLRPELEAVPGVASVAAQNGVAAREELQVVFDPWKAAELGIQLPLVTQQLASARDVSGGFTDVGRRRYTLRFAGEYRPDELAQLVLEWRDGRPVRLGDIASVQVAPSESNGTATQNGNPAVSIRINRANGANMLATLERVKARVTELNDTMLADQKLVLVQSFDASIFVYRALNLLGGNLLLGMLLAVGVLWWFMRRMRATLIVAAAIPISLLATFVVLSAAGRSVNVISLAGLAFATGMVLDAAIVVLENIIRLREKGKSPDEASAQGAGQVWGALLASTATTVAIFLPVFFLNSVEGQIFGDLALTIAVAVVFSLLVAVAVVPVAAKLWLPEVSARDRLAPLWDKISSRVMRLTATTTRRWRVIAVFLVLPLAATWLLLPKLDYLPPVKRDAVDVWLNFPAATNNKTIAKEVVAELDRRMGPYMRGEKEPALKNYYILTWPNGGTMGVRVKDMSKAADMERILRQEVLKDIPDFQGFAARGNLFGQFGGDRQIELHLQSKDAEGLMKAAAAGVEIIGEQMPGVPVQPNPGLSLAEPELTVHPDDRAIYEQGWNRQDMGSLIRALGNGLYVGEYFNGEKRLDVIFKAQEWGTPEQLENTPLVTPRGQITSLSQLASVERTVGPGSLRRVDGRRTISLRIVPPDNVSLEEVRAQIEADILPKIQAAMPADGSILVGGNASDLDNAIQSLSQNFVLALVILFLLMSALFRSLKDAALVLLTVPLATVGGVLALRLINLFGFQPLDLLTMIGFVILLGLVVNNAILLVHQTRAAEQEGLDRSSAVEQALKLRLRPIFMSTLTSVFGMLPLLVAPGEGSVIYRGLAAVIVGGMAVSTLFTLVLLPALLQTGKLPLPGLNKIQHKLHADHAGSES